MKRTATGNPEVMTLIARIHLTWKRHLQRALVGEDVTLKQYHLLVQLDERGYLRPAQVAEELFSDRPTASVMLRTMEKRGWISRTRDPDDGRLPKLAGDEGRMAGTSPAAGQDSLCGEHAVHVIRPGFRSHHDDRLSLLGPALGDIGIQGHNANRGTR